MTPSKEIPVSGERDQIRRLMAERDLLLSAIPPEAYAKIQAQMAAISESPDGEAING